LAALLEEFSAETDEEEALKQQHPTMQLSS
jgi:hypothetical protein